MKTSFIHLYTAATPNDIKAPLALEELSVGWQTTALSWLFLQVSGTGPAFGNAAYFRYQAGQNQSVLVLMKMIPKIRHAP